MKISVCQLEVSLGQPEKNVNSMLKYIEKAKKESCDLIVFPEMCVGGYFLSDNLLNESFCFDLESYNDVIKEASYGITVMFGNIFIDKSGVKYKNGKNKIYNALFCFRNGEAVESEADDWSSISGVIFKKLLNREAFLDEKRYFCDIDDSFARYDYPMDRELYPFQVKVGDGFVNVGAFLGTNYKNIDNTLYHLVNNGAELIINLRAEPFFIEKFNHTETFFEEIKHSSDENFIPFISVGCVGSQNSGKCIYSFNGDFSVYNSEGKLVSSLEKEYEEGNLYINLEDIDKLEVAKNNRYSDIELKYKSIVNAIKSFVSSLGNPKVVIGLSGGIDSAVVACLVERALGKDRVMGLNIPTKYNSNKTRGAALRLAQHLDIDYEVIPISKIVELNTEIIANSDLDRKNTPLSSLNEENIQAKIRGTSIISNIASKYGAVFTNNGNKLEFAVGYATLYGDMGGAFAPIGDLTKAEVFEMGKFLNEKIYKDEVISKDLFPNENFVFEDNQIAPSAELKNNQLDPMKFGYHCALVDAYTSSDRVTAEDILIWYMDGTICERLKISRELFLRWGLDDKKSFIEDLEWFDRRFKTSVFKRLQSPPIFLTSKNSFGNNYIESQLPYNQSKIFKKLKEKLLES